MEYETTLESAQKWIDAGFPDATRVVCSCGWQSPVCTTTHALAMEVIAYHLAKEYQCVLSPTTNIVH